MIRERLSRLGLLAGTFALAVTLTGTLTPATSLAGRAGDGTSGDPVTRGRYLAVISGCNDCHTPAYMEASGEVPEARWFTGSPVGFQGPWGTTYAANLRLTADRLSEQAWLARTRSTMLPPMPWFNLRQMSDADLLAVYAYLRSLGPAGEPAPAAVGPGQPVTTPFIEFVPRQPLAAAPR